MIAKSGVQSRHEQRAPQDLTAMAAMLKWSKAQEEADMARAEYDKAMFEYNKRIADDTSAQVQ